MKYRAAITTNQQTTVSTTYSLETRCLSITINLFTPYLCRYYEQYTGQ